MSRVRAISTAAGTGEWRLTLFQGITCFHVGHLHALNMHCCGIDEWLGQAEEGCPNREEGSHD